MFFVAGAAGSRHVVRVGRLRQQIGMCQRQVGGIVLAAVAGGAAEVVGGIN